VIALKRAIVSDIHGNLEALEAVLADIHDQGIDEIYCLGDIIGYGPNPRECIDKVRAFEFCLLGNHDQGALFDPEGFSSGAEKAIFWTRQQLESAEGDDRENLARWDFLCDLPRTKMESPFLFVHGSPRNPLNEYVFPEDVFNARKIEKLFSLVEHYCFQGHTHVPGVFTSDSKFLAPADLDHRFELKDAKVMVNVGSVGQPRDNDPRSCYVVLRDRNVEFRRVPYPLERTIEKIHAIAELDRFLGDRLRQGR
jgi:predicted phosphodiesterase